MEKRKKSKPLFKGHVQLQIPYKKDYYNLLDDEVIVRQMQLALKYGIDGFCNYRYWFKGRKLLEKPTKHLLKQEHIILPFCLCWANEAWTRTWDGDVGAQQILIAQDYGDETDWINHFKYLNSFFQRDEYIKVDGKPLIVIYKSSEIKDRKRMFKIWNKD